MNEKQICEYLTKVIEGELNMINITGKEKYYWKAQAFMQVYSVIKDEEYKQSEFSYYEVK